MPRTRARKLVIEATMVPMTLGWQLLVAGPVVRRCCEKVFVEQAAR